MPVGTYLTFFKALSFFFLSVLFFVSNTVLYHSLAFSVTTFSVSRTYTSKLKARVPMLMSYQALKSQFDWLMDREVEQLISENLQSDLLNIDLFLRQVMFQIEPIG